MNRIACAPEGVQEDIRITGYEADVVEALCAYDSMLGPDVQIDVNAAGQLRLAEAQSYTARSDSIIWHAGGAAARLTVVALAPHDTITRPGGQRQRDGVTLTGAASELHLTVLADRLGTDDDPSSGEPVLLAGSLDGVGPRRYGDGRPSRMGKIVTVGQREGVFLGAMATGQDAPPTATITAESSGSIVPEEWRRLGRHTYLNPLDGVLQIAAFVTMDLDQHRQFRSVFDGLEPQPPMVHARTA